MSRTEVIGSATLYLGDCQDILPAIEGIDAVVTDPPYGNGKRWQGGRREWRLGGGGADLKWDQAPFAGLADLLSKYAVSIVWGGERYALPLSRGWLVWDKKSNGFSSGDCELAWSSLDRPIRVFRLGRNIFTPLLPNWEQKLHPTQKPTDLMRWCIEQLPAGVKTIADPFMGSGTTGVACVNLGRKFIGIERSPAYFDMACRRMEEAQRQPGLFGVAP